MSTVCPACTGNGCSCSASMTPDPAVTTTTENAGSSMLTGSGRSRCAANWFLKRGFVQVDADWLPEARKRKYNWDRRSQVLVKKLA